MATDTTTDTKIEPLEEVIARLRELLGDAVDVHAVITMRDLPLTAFEGSHIHGVRVLTHPALDGPWLTGSIKIGDRTISLQSVTIEHASKTELPPVEEVLA